ncbi:HAD family hydrolase [Acidobacteria bacterium AH-259-A15]|nr:HAD family hydrolase [Acidobacteria bacterium AH-259-A15]
MMIKAITFDCWDTLLDDDVSRNIQRKKYLAQIFKENGITITEDEIDDLFWKEAKSFQEHIVRHRTTQNAMERAKTLIRLADVQIPISGISKIAEYSNRIALEFGPPLVSGVKEVLQVLSSSYRLAVICNTGWHTGKTVRQLLQERDLSKYFSHLTFSDEATVAKPHKQIFQYTLEKLACRPEDAVHIGDSEYSDIVGAKEANMKAILFAGINDKYKDNNTADLTISSYECLVEIIEKGI